MRNLCLDISTGLAYLSDLWAVEVRLEDITNKSQG